MATKATASHPEKTFFFFWPYYVFIWLLLLSLVSLASLLGMEVRRVVRGPVAESVLEVVPQVGVTTGARSKLEDDEALFLRVSGEAN